MTAARSRYSHAAIALHWLVALMLIGNFAGGLFMEGLLAPEATSEQKKLGFQIVQLHKSSGLASLMRLALRLLQGTPPYPAHMTPLERTLAKTTVRVFYSLMILIPLTGWVMVSASPLGFPTIWFGLFEWPHLPIETSKATSSAASDMHELLGLAGAGLLALHVAGALKHHFLDRDDVLARMLPLVRRRTA